MINSIIASIIRSYDPNMSEEDVQEWVAVFRGMGIITAIITGTIAVGTAIEAAEQARKEKLEKENKTT